MATNLSAEKIILAGGCFWGMQDILRKIPGVLTTKVGYAGGITSNPTYEQICTGKTGHAEVILIEFDSSMLSLKDLLVNHFFKMHDPTSLNRQGNDLGPQYRSAIFCQNPQQIEIAQSAIKTVDEFGWWPKKVVTEVKLETTFYEAEEYHQDYLEKNPNGYTCHFVRKF